MAGAVAQGLTADIFLQMTTTLAHLSHLHNSSGPADSDITADALLVPNGTFLNLARGCVRQWPDHD